MEEVAEFRSRSNTWPRKIKTESVEPPVEHSEEKVIKKNVFLGRRNIYGEFSYSDLITKAINSTTDKRMTLSQIYDWMLENVPVLSKKPEGMASWKNSIRHNLSLHNKFVKTPNTSSGRCSFWTIDPDAKPVKPPRRRAGSMESNKLELKRQRAKRIAQAHQPEPYVLPGYEISPAFRSRTWSNESSRSRLSPIPSEENLLNINERYYHPYENNEQFRPRSYSSGSSCGKVSPDYQYWTKPQSNQSTQLYNQNQYIDESVLSNTFQSNINLVAPVAEVNNYYQYNVQQTLQPVYNQTVGYQEQNVEVKAQGINMGYQDNQFVDTEYQCAMNIVYNNGVGDNIEDISLDPFKTPTGCDLEEVLNEEVGKIFK